MAEKKIRRTRTLTAVGTCFLGFVAYAGCSVPNRTYVDDTGGMSNGGGTSNGGGDTPNAGASDGGTSSGGTSKGGAGGGTSKAGGANSEAGAGGEAGDSGNNGLVRPVPTQGLIVIGGTEIDDTKGVISVIAPATGKELVREALPTGTQISGIAYDGADKKDVWYVFIGSSFPAKEDKVVDLQVRYFDDVGNAWITLSRVSTLPPPIPGTLTVLNDRLAYLSHVVVNNVATPSLTILDTTDVLKVTTIAASYTPTAPFDGSMVTLIGTRGTATDATGTGGTLDLGLAQACAGTTCQLFIQPIPVGDTIGSSSGGLLGTYQGTPVAYASRTSQLDYFALSPAVGNVKAYRAAPDAPETADSFDAPQKATDLADLTVAECQNTGALTAASENALYGVTLGAGVGQTLPLGRAGQLVAYEPFSTEVISTYNPVDDSFTTAAGMDAGIAGPEIDAVDVKSTGGASLMLSQRTKLWAPPTDLRSNVLVTRFPVPFTCP